MAACRSEHNHCGNEGEHHTHEDHDPFEGISCAEAFHSVPTAGTGRNSVLKEGDPIGREENPQRQHKAENRGQQGALCAQMAPTVAIGMP